LIVVEAFYLCSDAIDLELLELVDGEAVQLLSYLPHVSPRNELVFEGELHTVDDVLLKVLLLTLSIFCVVQVGGLVVARLMNVLLCSAILKWANEQWIIIARQLAYSDSILLFDPVNITNFFQD
jgi:hypothetical protein